MNLANAIALAANMFKDITDKRGSPYILHCLFVMEAGRNEDEKIAGVLHDVVEDTSITLMNLRQEGYSERSIALVDALTKRKGETYRDSIKRVAQDEGATHLKKRDLEHNTSVLRLKSLSKKNMDKLEEYFWAYTYLKQL